MLFDGNKFAQEKEKVLKVQFKQLAKKGIKPKLVFVLVGENEEAEFYVGLKEKAAKRLGVAFTTKHFSSKASLNKLYQCINSLNQNKKVGGITFEYPLPEKFKTVLPALIAPEKDVDCLTPFNLGRLMIGNWLVLPSSVKAVLEVLGLALDLNISHIIYHISPNLKGKLITIVGFGTLVGRPLSLVLKHLGATVTVCDEFTKDLVYFTRQAEILISATGQPGLIKKEMVKKGAVVIDLGFNKLKIKNKQSLIRLRRNKQSLISNKFENEKLKIEERVVGDVEPAVAQVASFFTPVPGGVGPVTIACLFENLLSLMETDKKQI